MIWKQARRALAVSLTALTLGGLLAAPITAHADGDKAKKGDTGTVVIGPPIITPDPPKKK